MHYETAPLARFCDGRVIPYWGDSELRLRKELFDSIAYAYPDESAAEKGDGSRGATAFWAGVKTVGGYIPFLVTNRHVIEDGATVFRFPTPQDPKQIVDTDERDWIFHDDPNVDLAIISPHNLPFSGMVNPMEMAVKESDVEGLSIRLGDDVCMIGRHRNYDGKQTNNPTARFGHLVQLPGDSVKDDRGRNLSAYFVQIPSLPGFSGSPVYLTQNPDEKAKEEFSGITYTTGPRPMRLLGINRGHLPAYAPTNFTKSGKINPDLEVEINSGVNVVIPAWYLDDMITKFLTEAKLDSLVVTD